MNAQISASYERSSTNESPRWLHTALTEAPNGECIIDRAGRIVFANETAQRRMRLVRDTAEPGILYAERMIAGPWLGRQALVRRVFRTQEPVVEPKLQVEWSDGERAVLCVHARPLREPPDGEIMGVGLTFIDVTTTTARCIRARRLRADRERLNHLKSLSTLAGGVAHEFNNLLVGIVGESELAMDVLETHHEAYSHLRHILHTARCAAELTQQLLIYSGKGRVLARTVAPSTALCALHEPLTRAIDKDVELTWDLPADLPLVELDQDQLRQCMTVLVLNAVQSIPRKRKGAIHVRATSRYLSADSLRDTIERSSAATPGRYLVIEVHDDGQGVGRSMHPRLFEPFFSSKLPGRGLELATVAGFARGHGGFVDFSSAVGKGTIMRLGLPVREGPSKRNGSAHTARLPVPKSLPLGVLIVDDEATVRSVAAMLLNRASATTFVTGDGESALSCFSAEREHIDVALVDMSMPGMNGVEVMSALRAVRPQLPVVLMSGFAADQVCEQDEITRFLAKPFNREQLFDAIQAIAPPLAAASSRPQ